MTEGASGQAPPLVLVTGAPRSGTTPIGHILALATGARMLYEPMGPTGDVRFGDRFPIPGEPNLTVQQFDAFLDDLVAIRLRLKAKRRTAYAKLPAYGRWLRYVVGSRTHVSLWCARHSLGRRTIIWKDPHACLAAPRAAHAGVPVVVCLRSPWAQAASFKRLGWISPVREIYARYRNVHGPVEAIERELMRIGMRALSPAESAALLWHLVYVGVSPLLLGAPGAAGTAQQRARSVLVSAGTLQRDEPGVYAALFAALGLRFDGQPRSALTRRIRSSTGRGGRNKVVHDWGRTVAATNDSWRRILDPDEEACARRINQPLFQSLESAALTADPHVTGEWARAAAGTE